MSNFAIVFPGQGSQSKGMINDFYHEFSVVRDLFDLASETLKYNLWSIITENSENKLNLTSITQPALLASSYAIWKVLQEEYDVNNKVSYLAGHSLGEYTAYTISGSWNFEDALKITAARGKFMQEAVHGNEVSMAAILGLSKDIVEDACENLRNDGYSIWVANYNSDKQIVVSGETKAIEKSMLLFKELKAKLSIKLPVSIASHCPLMQSAVQKLDSYLNNFDFKMPKYDIINNIDANFVELSTTSRNVIMHKIISQMVEPVLWYPTLKKLLDLGVKNIIEVGAGNVLTKINKRLDIYGDQINSIAVNNLTGLQQLGDIL